MGRNSRAQKCKGVKKTKGGKAVVSDELVKACMRTVGISVRDAACFPSSKTFSIAEGIHADTASGLSVGVASTRKGVDVGDVYIQLLHSACKRFFDAASLYDTYFFVARLLWLFAWRDRAEERRAARAGTVQCALAILIHLYKWKPSTTSAGDQAEPSEMVDNMTPDVKSRILSLCESLGYDCNVHTASSVLPSRCAQTFDVRSLLPVDSRDSSLTRACPSVAFRRAICDALCPLRSMDIDVEHDIWTDLYSISLQYASGVIDLQKALVDLTAKTRALQNHAKMLTSTKKHTFERFFSASKTDRVHNTYVGQYARHDPKRDTTSFYEHLRGVYAGGKRPLEGV